MSAQLQLFESRDSSERWTVRVSRRARRMSVRVYPGGRVEVVVPPGVPPVTVQRFVGTHSQWIARRVEDLSAVGAPMTAGPPSEIQVPAIGRNFKVDYQHTRSTSIRPQLFDDGVLRIFGPIHDEAAIATALRQWLSDLAYDELGSQLKVVARELGLSFSRIQIRRQRTRWGSCSATGTISLNVCLMFLDPAVVRYLFVHELCHTRHMNHSSRFWALVEHHEPDYRRLDRELLKGWQSVPAWMFE
ncbi:zinc protease [Steroidobacter agaridevorans]|uniref:Zinc protease n=1 Tax=Steroidobacter agaridevorans TaxID=2695856 RepID=A0A829YJH5_9GAMM|nr:YgjP-like metallopeptidase domain-containing protein [Steroidobacter agaridevorans]GFE83524.1 zinc protease [Steroidobacter agaridevorans]GFE86594.1 zinc protease [Steroidobacter agaridevorans]